MKRLMLVIAIIVAMAVSVKSVKAQDYKASIGLSLGAPTGIDYKQFFSPHSAINATFGHSFMRRNLALGAVYQYHIPLVKNFNFYVGAGVNFGAHFYGHDYTMFNDEKGEFLFGLTPNVGIEYKFLNAPVALGFDYRPSVNLTTDSQWNLASLKIRFTF